MEEVRMGRSTVVLSVRLIPTTRLITGMQLRARLIPTTPKQMHLSTDNIAIIDLRQAVAIEAEVVPQGAADLLHMEVEGLAEVEADRAGARAHLIIRQLPAAIRLRGAPMTKTFAGWRSCSTRRSVRRVVNVHNASADAATPGPDNLCGVSKTTSGHLEGRNILR